MLAARYILYLAAMHSDTGKDCRPDRESEFEYGQRNACHMGTESSSPFGRPAQRQTQLLKVRRVADKIEHGYDLEPVRQPRQALVE